MSCTINRIWIAAVACLAVVIAPSAFAQLGTARGAVYVLFLNGASSGELLLDLGDMAVGGDGTGTGTTGAGIRIGHGGLLAPLEWGGAGGNAPFFRANDGGGGAADLEFVDGVFASDGLTPIDSQGGEFSFPNTGAGWWDAVRKDIAVVDGPGISYDIELLDMPGVPRRGLGVHANGGITFDLDAVRAAHPGAQLLHLNAVAGLNVQAEICDGADPGDVETWVLVDGEVRHHQTFEESGSFEALTVVLTDRDRFLTIAATDFDANYTCDWSVFADALLVLNLLCPWDFNDNGLVGSGDLIFLLGAWGENPGHQADLNGDDVVDTIDLIELLGNWGPCR